MDVALNLLNGHEKADDIVLTPYLVERASCAPAPPGVSGGCEGSSRRGKEVMTQDD